MGDNDRVIGIVVPTARVLGIVYWASRVYHHSIPSSSCTHGSTSIRYQVTAHDRLEELESYVRLFGIALIGVRYRYRWSRCKHCR